MDVATDNCCWSMVFGGLSARRASRCTGVCNGPSKKSVLLIDRFCAACIRDGFFVPLDRVRALRSPNGEPVLRNNRTACAWTFSTAGGFPPFRVVNHTFCCSGPHLVIFHSPPPPPVAGSRTPFDAIRWRAVPDAWLSADQQTVHLRVANGTLVPYIQLRAVPLPISLVNARGGCEAVGVVKRKRSDTCSVTASNGLDSLFALGNIRSVPVVHVVPVSLLQVDSVVIPSCYLSMLATSAAVASLVPSVDVFMGAAVPCQPGVVNVTNVVMSSHMPGRESFCMAADFTSRVTSPSPLYMYSSGTELCSTDSESEMRSCSHVYRRSRLDAASSCDEKSNMSVSDYKRIPCSESAMHCTAVSVLENWSRQRSLSLSLH